MQNIRLALGVAEAAKAAGVGRTTLFEAIRKGQIAAKKVGRRTIITTDELNAWLNSLPPRSTAVTRAGEGR
jgi:excisionase family DNA binding protein